MPTAASHPITPEPATHSTPPTPTQPQTPLPRVLEPEQRVVLRGINWEGYEAILRAIGDQPAVRLAYLHGDLELASPSIDYNIYKTLFGRLIETLTMEFNIPCEGFGSATWKEALAEVGLEPDECYYIANSEKVAGRANIDLTIDPPPDLAIEIEISRSAIHKLEIYASLGVSEVWRFDGETLTVDVLQADRTYQSQSSSPSFPFLSLDRLVDWIKAAEGVSQTTWTRRFQKWVLEEFGPKNS
jgi:Uma2 family endonuclease